jgi:hypothetical protein
MKYSKLIKERVRRVGVLLREMGFDLVDGEVADGTYSAAFEGTDGFQGGVFIDRESKFLELAYTFTFSANLSAFVRSRLEEVFQVCYEFGCYMNLQTSEEEVSFSIFAKIYYAGLNYYALKETIRDFREAVEALSEILDLKQEVRRGETGADS